MISSSAVPYVVPFAIFIILMALFGSVWHAAPLTEQLVRAIVMVAVLWFFARPVLDFRVRRWAATTAVGALIFLLWILPDLLFPHYREFWLFNNPLMRTAAGAPVMAGQNLTLALRSFRAIVIVPIVEELFWRAWLMRWIISTKFEQVPLGTYAATAFWAVAGLFALEHGMYWDVGLLAGIIFNLWMVRTKSLGDLIWAHAVANGCLSAYVIAAGRWEYWP